MLTTELIDFVRDQTFVGVDQISNSRMLTYARFAYKRVISILNNVGDYVSEIFTSDLKANQSEYGLPVADNDTVGIDKLSRVSINYGSGFVDAKRVSVAGNIEDFSVEQLTGTESDPSYVLFDNSVFIFPAPKVSVYDGIKLYGNISVIDLTLDATSKTVLDDNWTYAVALAMIEMIQKSRGQTEKKNDSISEFVRYTNDLIDNYVLRDKKPVFSQVSSISNE